MANAKQKAALKKKVAQTNNASSWTGVDKGAKTVGTRSTKPRQKKVVAPRANRRAK